jgi:putative flippase GtrA
MATLIMRRPRPVARMLPIARSAAPRLLRFACTGVIAGTVQLALLHLWIARGWDGLLANTVAYLVSAQVNFLLSETFIWGDRGGMRRATTLLRRWVAFHSAILGTATSTRSSSSSRNWRCLRCPQRGSASRRGRSSTFSCRIGSSSRCDDPRRNEQQV